MLSRSAIVLMLLLELICGLQVYQRLYQVFLVDGGVIFGDVTCHYFPAGMAIINGHSPYDSPFITHPPLMLLLFAAAVYVHPAPYSIGILIMCTYFLLPPLALVTALQRLSERLSVLTAWVVTLNPLTTHGFVVLIDDDVIIMLGLLVVVCLYPRHRVASSLAAAIFGGMKFVPLLAGVFLVMLDKNTCLACRLRLLCLQAVVFSCIMVLGTALWGSVTLTRLLHYTSYVKIDYPAMNPYYVLFVFCHVPEYLLRLASGVAAAVLVSAYFLFRRRSQGEGPDWTVLDATVACVVVLLGNVETSYMYYSWLIPLASLVALGALAQKRIVTSLCLLIECVVFGYLASEWAYYTWAYGESFLVWAYVASCIAPFVLLCVLAVACTSRTQQDAGSVTFKRTMQWEGVVGVR